MIEYISDQNQQPEIHPISRNNEIFLNTKLTRKPGYIKQGTLTKLGYIKQGTLTKPGYIKQGTLTKDKERNKEKGRPFPVINKYGERDILFQVRRVAVTYSEAVQQKKKVAIICDSMPKSTNLSKIKRKFRRNAIVYRKNFPGVNSVHINHHIIATLLEDKPDIVIVHVGINDILNRFDQDQIIKNIQQIYITCKNFNVNQVIVYFHWL